MHEAHTLFPMHAQHIAHTQIHNVRTRICTHACMNTQRAHALVFIPGVPYMHTWIHDKLILVLMHTHMHTWMYDNYKTGPDNDDGDDDANDGLIWTPGS